MACVTLSSLSNVSNLTMKFRVPPWGLFDLGGYNLALDRRFLSIDDLTHLPHPKWMIEGLFEANSLVMLAGPPGSYKSFLSLDWMMHMVSGRKWNDRETTTGKVLYVLGEGKASLLKRIHAWTFHHKPTDDENARIQSNFRVSFDVPQMAAKSSVDNMLSQLSSEKYEPNVIVVDTFARSFVGLDENGQKDTGLWIEAADRLRQLGYTVIFLHHTAKNTEFGLKYRGSSAIMGAMDTAMTMDRDYQNQTKVVVKVTKQKDHDEGPPMTFSRLIVKPYPDDDEGSVVLVPAPTVIDERFTVEGQAVDASVRQLLSDVRFDSDRARARELSRLFPDISEAAAQSKIVRRRKS